MSSIRQVAQAANVSAMTASLALRGHPKITEATRRRVLQAAKRLNYQVDPAVSQAMALGRHKKGDLFRGTLAFIENRPKPDSSDANPYFKRILQGATSRAKQHGYRIDALNLRSSRLSLRRLESILTARGIRGLIFAPFRQEVALNLDWDKFAAVSLTNSISNITLSQVLTDYFRGMTLALDHLARNGCQRVLFLEQTELRHHSSYHLWNAAFISYPELGDASLRLYRRDLSAIASSSFKAYLARFRIDSIVTYAPDCLPKLQSLGLSIPQKIAFASLNQPYSQAPCAGIDPGPEQIGAAAVDILYRRLEQSEFGLQHATRTTLIPPNWIEGPTIRSQAAEPSESKAG